MFFWGKIGFLGSSIRPDIRLFCQVSPVRWAKNEFTGFAGTKSEILRGVGRFLVGKGVI